MDNKPTKPNPKIHQTTLHAFMNKTIPSLEKQKRDQPREAEKSKQKEILGTVTLKSEGSNISAKTDPIPLYNVLFYSNKIQSDPKGDFIDDIHRLWWKNYTLLESHHGFIQWIFPNEFKSRFNERAFPIAREEIDHFLHDPAIYMRYVKTYEMMLQFYGMVLKDKKTGQLKRSRNPSYEVRYYKTLITSYHNHMRITRILSSLSVLGFSEFAKQLSIFLKEEIYGSEGGLKPLAKLKVYEREWGFYADIDCEALSRSDYFKSFK